MNKNSEVIFAEERKAEIVKLINKKRKVMVPELISQFNVSPATIRNDLRELETHGLINRTHGGAIAIDYVKAGFELDNKIKNIKNLKEKQEIAKKAADIVEDGDIIILDTGTTTLEMAKLLKNKKNITALVNDIKIALYLEKFKGVDVIVIGGSLRKNFHCTTGPFAINLLSTLNVDKVFLATNAFSIEKGCTTPDIDQAEVKKVMVQVSTQTIVLCDSSKIGKNSFIQFISPNKINALITDDNISHEMLEEISEQGIEVYVAKS